MSGYNPSFKPPSVTTCIGFPISTPRSVGSASAFVCVDSTSWRGPRQIFNQPGSFEDQPVRGKRTSIPYVPSIGLNAIGTSEFCSINATRTPEFGQPRSSATAEFQQVLESQGRQIEFRQRQLYEQQQLLLAQLNFDYEDTVSK